MSFPGWSTTVFIFCDSWLWVPRWSWAVLQKNPPASAHSLVFQHLLYIWTLSNIDCMILRSIFSHWGQLRDSYTAITKGGNIYGCSRKPHSALSKLLNRMMMCKFFSFCLTIIFFHLVLDFRSYINTYMFPRRQNKYNLPWSSKKKSLHPGSRFKVPPSLNEAPPSLNALCGFLEHQYMFSPFVIAVYESLSCPQC